MISLIIPFFNEESELPDLINDLEEFENKDHLLINEYIFINDSSTDKSIFILNRKIKETKFLKKKKIKIITNDVNMGWCKSLLKGYKLATQKYSLYIPGDGEARITEFLQNYRIDINTDVAVFQRKSMKGRPKIRVLISYLYKKIIGLIFNLPNIDFNGIILAKSEVLKKIELNSKSNFISAEIILKAKKNKFKINFDNYFFLFQKKKYKSSSLSFNQLKIVIIDLINFYLEK